MVEQSATLAVNEKVAARRAAGQAVLHLGFGEAGLPVLPSVVEALAAAAAENAYGSVAGSEAARAAVAGYFSRRGLGTEPGQVLLGPGSKALLYAVLAVLPGDVVLPQPSWVTYAAQAAMTGKRVVSVPVPREAGGVPDPALLEAAVHGARRAGADPRIVILTLPDNPTGTAPKPDLVKQVVEVAVHLGLTIVSDEIYRDLAYDLSEHLSPASIAPDRTVITGGLSKSMALGGWRIGFARMPDGPDGRELRQRVLGVASEVWSSLPTPMQTIIPYVLAEPPEIVEHITASRRLHARVSRAVHTVFIEAGATCRSPGAAFYLYPDFESLRDRLANRGVHTGAGLADHLLDEQGIAVLAGRHFGDDPAGLRFRVATSLLYGSDAEERWQALRTDDPLELPWIAGAIDTLRLGLGTLAA
jgi:aspartate aminotransferase